MIATESETTEPTFDQTDFFFTCLSILNSPDATLDDYLLVAKSLKVDLPARFTWRPRPDQPEKYDQQTAFYNSDSRGVIWLLGGNGAGCLGAEQEVFDPVLGKSRRVSEIDGPFHVWARTSAGEVVVAKASKPRVYGKEDLYRVTLSNGRSVVVTLGHRVLSESDEWREIGDIVRRAQASSFQPLSVAKRSQSHVSECAKLFAGHNAESKQFDWLKVLRRTSVRLVELANNWLRHAGHVLRFSPFQVLSSGLQNCIQILSRGCGLHWLNKPSGCQDRCFQGLHPCDEQLPRVSGIDRVSVLQSACVGERSLSSWQTDDLACALEYSLACLGRLPQSTHGSGFQVRQSSEVEYAFSGACSRSFDAADISLRSFQSSTVASRQNSRCPQFPEAFSLIDTSQSSLASAMALEVSFSASMGVADFVSAYVTSIEFVRHDEYWDFSVEEHENYWMAGAWHHNTTETTMAKVAKLVRTIPAPRKDTPFWIIAGSYDQSMNTCWKEKLYGHGHITDEQIDWERIEWYRPKSQLPFKVPLLPQPCQKDKELFRKHVPEKFPYAPAGNWCLEFKSWRQGDHQMMAQSIGGFAFVEQFPWDVFTETMRGCREYFLPGSMLVEYTPVDPDLSGDIEAMIQGGPEPEKKEDCRPGVKYLPRGWEVYHANTECALEAGHVAKEWFDQYFGMIPSESRDMRLKGLFASFEGVIYKTFDPTVHVVGDEIFEWISSQNCFHRRALDWGAGPHNAFAALWGAKNHFNQWFIYDEYYSVDQEATVIDHLVNISQQQFWPENHPLYGTTYVDPARPDNIRLAQQLAMQIKRYGTGDEKETVKNMNITLARNSVFEGIEHVQWLLKKSVPEWNEFAGADGNGGMIMRPRLFVHHSCTNLIRELKKYRWIKQTGIGKTDNPVSARPEPLKLDDHCCDALRYLVFSDDSKCGLTIESIKKQSKAAQTVHGKSGQNANWRDIISNHGESAVGERYGRTTAGKRRGIAGRDVTSIEHGQE